MLSDCTAPFRVEIFTDNDVDAGDNGATANVKASRGKSKNNESR